MAPPEETTFSAFLAKVWAAPAYTGTGGNASLRTPLLADEPGMRSQQANGSVPGEQPTGIDKGEEAANLSIAKWSLYLFTGMALADVASSLVLYVSLHDWKASCLEPWQFFDALFPPRREWFDNFQLESADDVAMAGARCLVLPGLALLAVYLGRPAASRLAAHRATEGDGVIEAESAESPLTDEEIAAMDHKAEVIKAVIQAFSFLLCTLCQAYAGAKCVSFAFGEDEINTLRACLMGSAVVWINAESIALARAVAALTEPPGVLRPGLHYHPLRYMTSTAGVRCNNCRQRCAGGSHRCTTCNYDACSHCFRNNRPGAEGGLRGDKGARLESEVKPAQYLQRALALARPEAHLFALAFLCLAVTSCTSLLLPTFQGRIINSVVTTNWVAFRKNVLTYVSLSAVTALVGGCRGLCFEVVGRRMAYHVRNKLFRGIIIQDVAFFDGATTGDLTSRLAYDATAMVAPCQSMLASTLTNVFQLLGGLFMCFTTSWRLSMLAFTTVLPITYITTRYARWSKRLNQEIFAVLGQASTVANEALANIRTVRALSNEQVEMDAYTERTTEALQKGVRDALGAGGAFALNNCLDLGAGVLILWYGGLLVMDKQIGKEDLKDAELTLGGLITYQLYFNMIQSSYKGLQNVLTSLTRAAGAAQRVFSLMDSLPDIDPNGGFVPREPMRGELHIRDVFFHYQMRPDLMVLKGLSLQINAGSTCALVGRSGGGKSTIINLIMRFYDPTEGAILIDGQPLPALNLRWVHRNMGLVAQETQLFAKTIKENLVYGAENYTEDDIIEAARAANAHDFVASFPDGYETRVGERGVRLSGGQKQRLAIARVMLRKPRILLLDEATSALDAESEALVQEALDKLIGGGGRTIVLVAHRLSTVVNADKIAVVDGGAVSEQGNHGELLAVGGVYARLVARQLAKQANTLSEGKEGEAGPADTIDGLMDCGPSGSGSAPPKKGGDDAPGPSGGGGGKSGRQRQRP